MSLKENAKPWTVKEMIIEDPVSGLTFQFEVLPNGEQCLRIFGEPLEYGNRSFTFSPGGVHVGSGTSVKGLCRAAWITEVEVEPTGEGSIPKFPCSRKEFEEGDGDIR